MARQVGHIIEDKERTIDVLNDTNVTFKDLLLSQNVLSGLKKAGFDKPSPIQLEAIPFGRCGLDLIVQAKSGTGKTCVFTVIALEAVSTSASVLQAIILAPTREIALQIEDVIKAIGQDLKGLAVSSFIGGRPVSEDKQSAKGCHIAVGSPGRIFQLIDLEILKCENIRMLVLDEADKLLEQNFQKQINSIYSMLPVNKQMIAASATYPEELANFVTRYMRDPTFVRLNPKDMALLGVKQYFYQIPEPSDKFISKFETKIKAVIELLELYPFRQTLIFSNYHTHAKDLSESCNNAGLSSTFISGNLEQERRIDAIKMLKEFKCRVLISTDLTSRGIDASNVDLVLNLDVPQDWETYMHRTGRAGRFGSLGAVISVVTSGNELERLLGITRSCGISIYPVNLKDGKLNLATSPLDVNCGAINVLKSHEVDKTNNRPAPPTASGKIRHSNKSLPIPSHALKTEDNSISDPSSSHSLTRKTTNTFPNRQMKPKIPSLPELMLKGKKPDSQNFCFSYTSLLENLAHYKNTGYFKELKKVGFEVEEKVPNPLGLLNELSITEKSKKTKKLNLDLSEHLCSKSCDVETNHSEEQRLHQDARLDSWTSFTNSSRAEIKNSVHGVKSTSKVKQTFNKESEQLCRNEISNDLSLNCDPLGAKSKYGIEKSTHKSHKSVKQRRTRNIEHLVPSVPLLLPRYSNESDRECFNQEFCSHCYLQMQRQYALMWQNHYHCAMWKQWFDMQSYVRTNGTRGNKT